jgi:hypothetical protein
VPVLILAFILFVILAGIALTAFTLVLGAARAWSSTVNVVGLALSSGLLLASAAVTFIWAPSAFSYSLTGFIGGCLLGVVGLALSRWESARGSLHYTPNRWLVLGITLVVSARVAFGFWRSWHAWGSTPDYASWAAASGAAGSLAAGAVVLGYYLVYWLGVRRRLRRIT